MKCNQFLAHKENLFFSNFDVSHLQKVRLSVIYVGEVEKMDNKLKCHFLDPSIHPIGTIVTSNMLKQLSVLP